MTEQILDLKEQAAAIDVVFKLEAECRKRGLEIERQAAEIAKLRSENITLKQMLDAADVVERSLRQRTGTPQ
jgi:hypothetical protein